MVDQRPCPAIDPESMPRQSKGRERMGTALPTKPSAFLLRSEGPQHINDPFNLFLGMERVKG